jgi:glycosyltransferase 2 family protein
VISLILLVIIFWSADLDELRDELLQADYRYLPPALLCFLGLLIARALAWRTLLEEKASFRKTFFALAEGYFINNIFPFRLGDVARAFFLSRTTPLRFWQIIPTIVIERSLDLLIVVCIFLATLPFVVGIEDAQGKAILAGVVVAVALFTLVLIAYQQRRVLAVYRRLHVRLPFLKRFDSPMEAFLQGLTIFTQPVRFLKMISWQLIAWILTILHYHLMLLMFIPDAKIFWATFGVSTVGLGVAVPSAPGGLGVIEAIVVFVWGLFAVNQSKALAYALLLRAANLFTTAIPGIYGLMADGESIIEVYRQLRTQTRQSNAPGN